MAGWGFARTGELARGCGAVQKWHVCVRAQFPASHFRLTIFDIKTARRTGGASVLSAGDELTSGKLRAICLRVAFPSTTCGSLFDPLGAGVAAAGEREQGDRRGNTRSESPRKQAFIGWRA